MEDTVIYGPKPGQPPVFNIDDIHVCAATVAGFRAVLITGAPNAERALEAVQVLITELADWLQLHDLAPVTDHHFTQFHRVGRTTAHPAVEPGQWPFTFTVDPAGAVFLYPTPHKDLTTVTGELLVPTSPPLFSAPSLSNHDAEPRSAAGRLGTHLTSLLALHRIDAAVHTSAADRTYRAAGEQRVRAAIHPDSYLRPDRRPGWIQAVLDAVDSIPHVDTQVIEPHGAAPQVIIDYHGPAKPWRIGD
ncbi:hypothetical protein VXE65_19930 [Mycolicibacterium conceptionense]|uniref:hypothetical protein n=1 Tax=Mycolicibacterium conceptionense TaxID=451644 RepID=UPI0032049B72